MRSLCLCLVLLGLAACAETAEHRVARINAENFQDDTQCQNYGARPGTQTYTECRMIIATQRANNETAKEIARQQAATQLMITGATIAAGR